MNMDAELEVWRRQWQAETAVPLGLRRRVERQSRLMKLALIAKILVTIVIGGNTTVWALRSPQPDIVLLAGATWLFLAAAWLFTLTVNRGKWSRAALDTVAFLDLSVGRCRSRLAAIRFGAGLFLCELAFCLGWIYRHHSPEQRKPVLTWLLFSSVPMDFVWLFTLTFFGFVVWYRRRKRAELAYLLNLHGQVAGTTPDIRNEERVALWRVRRGKRIQKA